MIKNGTKQFKIFNTTNAKHNMFTCSMTVSHVKDDLDYLAHLQAKAIDAGNLSLNTEALFFVKHIKLQLRQIDALLNSMVVQDPSVGVKRNLLNVSQDDEHYMGGYDNKYYDAYSRNEDDDDDVYDEE